MSYESERGITVDIRGPIGAGKTTVARIIWKTLADAGVNVGCLDHLKEATFRDLVSEQTVAEKAARIKAPVVIGTEGFRRGELLFLNSERRNDDSNKNAVLAHKWAKREDERKDRAIEQYREAKVPTLFAFQPDGPGSQSFFVMAFSEAEARAAVDEIVKDNLDGWYKGKYTMTVLGIGEIITNDND